MSIGKRVVQIALVVRDIETAKKRWTDILGTEPFQEFSIPGWSDAPAYYRGKPVDVTDVKAVKFLLDGNIMLGLFEPDAKASPWKEHLDKYGESVCFLELDAPNGEEARETIQKSCKVDEPEYVGYQKGVEFALFDTKDLLGVSLNLVLPQEDDTLIGKLNEDPELFGKIERKSTAMNGYSRKSRLSTLLAHPQCEEILKKYIPDLMGSDKLSLAGMLDLETICGFAHPQVLPEKLEQMEKELKEIK